MKSMFVLGGRPSGTVRKEKRIKTERKKQRQICEDWWWLWLCWMDAVIACFVCVCF